MIEAPGMLMIGSAGRNAGKTELACALIRRFRSGRDVAAAKVTTVREADGACPRGGRGCGVCSSLSGAFCITEETSAEGAKDTQRLLAAGAAKVYWLRVLKHHLEEGAAALMELLGPNSLTVCESNTLRTVVEPTAFLMVYDPCVGGLKESARFVRQHVDRLVAFKDGRFDLYLDDVSIHDGTWAVRLPATAIVLAGGKSSRMGFDKSLLPVGGKPLIEQLFGQLRPHFKQIIVSADEKTKYPFLDVAVVPDEVPDQGPLMGIQSVLKASEHDLNLVVAGDMPRINIAAAKRLLRAAQTCDGAVARTAAGAIEPLFAVYRKTMLGAIESALASGKRRVRDAFQSCAIAYVDIGDAPWLTNLNTPEDYAAFLSQGHERG